MSGPLLTESVRRCVLEADAKALATCLGEQVNVVPVSLVRIADGTIWLIDLFMEKTSFNLARNPRAALVCWKETAGYQIKGRVEYLRQGDLFDQARRWVAAINPDRLAKGLILLTPEEVFDISPTKDTAAKFF